MSHLSRDLLEKSCCSGHAGSVHLRDGFSSERVGSVIRGVSGGSWMEMLSSITTFVEKSYSACSLVNVVSGCLTHVSTCFAWRKLK